MTHKLLRMTGFQVSAKQLIIFIQSIYLPVSVNCTRPYSGSGFNKMQLIPNVTMGILVLHNDGCITSENIAGKERNSGESPAKHTMLRRALELGCVS